MEKNKTVIIVTICFVLSVFVNLQSFLYAEDSFVFSNSSKLSEFKMSQKQGFDNYKEKVNNEFIVYKNILNEEFNKYKEEITEFWQDGQMSGAKTWIEYSKDYKTRKIVDFEKGTITIEVITDVNTDISIIDESITGSLTDLASETNRIAFQRDSFAQNVEERLVASIEDVKVSHSIAETPIASDMITGEAFPDNEKIESSVKKMKKNGEVKTRPAKSENQKIVSFQIQIPNARLQRKALQYIDNVEKYSRERKLEPSLVFAIMQTESSFNPMARSYVPAYGLMQIVPNSAGKDAANALFGEYRLLAPSFLYDCENNIKVGTAYISIVMYKYLRKIKNFKSRTYCAIAAYNTGTTNVARAFITKARMSEAVHVINKMTPENVYKTLIEKLPHAETRSYLEKVKTRMQHYVKR